ncbi:MAG: 6,7-dimethyl-8-ribityllumazine synthase [Acidimicrobiales bacterium]
MESTHSQQYRIAFVQSCWHDDIVGQARSGFLSEVEGLAEVETFDVPGAFELPLHVRTVAESGRFDAVVAAGFVVDGGIYRHEFVADAVISGLMRVQLDSGVPVFSSVLTPQQFHESADHRAFFSEHMVGKGHEVAKACLATLDARAALIAA